jgi:predicted RNase H-like HicB family nuclease
MRHYIGVVHKDAGSDYGVSFPDFPGAVTAARTIDEVVEMAQEALALHVEGMLAEGESIPEPSSFDQVRAEPEFSDGLPVLVPLKTDALVMRVNVTLPAAILRRIDEYAEERGLTRSGFLAEAARHELDNELREAARHELDNVLRARPRLLDQSQSLDDRFSKKPSEADVLSLLDALRAQLTELEPAQSHEASTTPLPPEAKRLKAKRKPQAKATPK